MYIMLSYLAQTKHLGLVHIKAQIKPVIPVSCNPYKAEAQMIVGGTTKSFAQENRGMGAEHGLPFLSSLFG